jgi:hypothetical protein
LLFTLTEKKSFTHFFVQCWVNWSSLLKCRSFLRAKKRNIIWFVVNETLSLITKMNDWNILFSFMFLMEKVVKASKSWNQITFWNKNESEQNGIFCFKIKIKANIENEQILKRILFTENLSYLYFLLLSVMSISALFVVIKSEVYTNWFKNVSELLKNWKNCFKADKVSFSHLLVFFALNNIVNAGIISTNLFSNWARKVGHLNLKIKIFKEKKCGLNFAPSLRMRIDDNPTQLRAETCYALKHSKPIRNFRLSPFLSDENSNILSRSWKVGRIKAKNKKSIPIYLNSFITSHFLNVWKILKKRKKKEMKWELYRSKLSTKLS